MREIRTSGLMSGVGKRGGPSGSVLAPNLDSTERGQDTAKSLGINLGNGRVCTTFAIEFEPLGEAEAELLEERFLLGSRFGDTA